MLSPSPYVRPGVSLNFLMGHLIELDSILAMPFGRFEVAERKSDHMSWDVSYPNVG